MQKVKVHHLWSDLLQVKLKVEQDKCWKQQIFINMHILLEFLIKMRINLVCIGLLLQIMWTS